MRVTGWPASGIALVCVLHTSCVTDSWRTPTYQAAVDLAKYDSIRIEVFSVVPNKDREVQMIEALTVARLTARRLFHSVVPASRNPSAQASLILRARITQLRDVSPSLRNAADMIAGPALVGLEVLLIDSEQGAEVGGFIAKSFAFGGMFGPTTSDAISRIVDEILEYVENGKTQSAADRQETRTFVATPAAARAVDPF